MSIRQILMSYGPPQPVAVPPPAQVLARTLYIWGLQSSNCAVQHFAANGVCHQAADTGAADYNWLVSGVNSDYQLRVTHVSGTTVPTFSAGWANNTWIAMSSDRTFYLLQTVAGILTSVCDVSIRYASNSTVIMTAQHSLSAESKK